MPGPDVAGAIRQLVWPPRVHRGGGASRPPALRAAAEAALDAALRAAGPAAPALPEALLQQLRAVIDDPARLRTEAAAHAIDKILMLAPEGSALELQVRSSLLPGLAAALVDCVRQRRHAPGGVAASAITLLIQVMQHDFHATMAEITALGDAAAGPLLVIAADNDRVASAAAFGALTIFIGAAPTLAARCAACPPAVGAAARAILSTGVGPTDPGCVALGFLSAAASLQGGCADVLAAQPQVVRAAVRAVAGADAGVRFNATRLLGQMTTFGSHDTTRELLREPGALAALVRQLSPPAEAGTRWNAAVAVSMAVDCDEAAARAVLQLGALGPLVALFDTSFSTDPSIAESLIGGRLSDNTTFFGSSIVLLGLHSLVRAAGDGGASFARAVYPALGGFGRAMTAVARERGLPVCSAAMSLLCALSSEASGGQLRLLAARTPGLVTGAAKALCCLLGGAVDDLIAEGLCCPVYGSYPHILHTFGVIAIPETGDLSPAFASAAWLPEVVAALQAAVAEPPTAASSADAAFERQQGDEACGRAESLARQELRRAAAELLQRLQAARDMAAEQQPQQQQQRRRQQLPSTQPQAGGPAAPIAAGAVAASQRCAECGAGARLRLCRGCRAVRYCGEECARRAWKGGHRAECLAAQAAGQQAGQQPSGQQLQPQS